MGASGIVAPNTRNHRTNDLANKLETVPRQFDPRPSRNDVTIHDCTTQQLSLGSIQAASREEP
jgi:hypothetical protein